MKRMQLVSAGTLQRLRHEAQQAWVDRDLKRCIETLERAHRLAPADVSILLQLGRMQGLNYNYAAAEDCFEKVVRVAPTNRKAEALAAAGQQARDFYNTQIAERYFQRAVQEQGVSPEALVKAAEFCERRRRMEEASALVDRALQLNGQSVAAWLARARLDQRAGKLEQAEQELRVLTKSADPENRVRAGYELGTVLDRLGRHDDAMAAFLEAKFLLRVEGAPHLDHLRKVRRHLAQLREALDEEILRRWAQAGSELQPQRRLALLGGHPRSGTTLLEQVLDSHDDIVSAEETSTFTDEAYRPLQELHERKTAALTVLDSAPMDVIRKSREDYSRVMDLCLGQPVGTRLLVDKNPSLTLMVGGLVRVFPEIKFLIALRDPRDVVLSCFMQPFVPVQQVSSAYLRLEDAVVEYVELMSMWRKLKPLLPVPYLEVRYEDMVDDLELVARKALDFLGVAWDDRVLGFDEHARQKLVRSPTYADVTQKVFKRARGRWRNYQKYLEPHLATLDPFVKAFGYE